MRFCFGRIWFDNLLRQRLMHCFGASKRPGNGGSAMLKAALVIGALLFVGSPALAQSPGTGGPGPVLKACAADIKSLCQGVQPGGGRIIACVKEHQAEA